MWGVVLMTVTAWNGTTAIYGDRTKDTYVGWFENVEDCMRSAETQNDGRFLDWISFKPVRTFACMRRPDNE